MAAAGLSVEEARGRAARRRFVELAWFLHHDEPRWAPPLAAYERWRLDRYRHPYYREALSQRFLARRAGRVVGRIMAHLAAEGDHAGWFGFFDVDDDADAAAALVAAAGDWCGSVGARTLTGPVSPTAADECGVLVDGFAAAGVTGRAWHPAWYPVHLAAAGLSPVAGSDRRTFRVDTVRDGAKVAGGVALQRGGAAPRHAGRWLDRRLVSPAIAAVPDVSALLRTSPLALARAARRGFDTCCVVRGGDDPVALASLAAVAGAGGYRSLVAPASLDAGASPETVHCLFTTAL